MVVGMIIDDAMDLLGLTDESLSDETGAVKGDLYSGEKIRSLELMIVSP